MLRRFHWWRGARSVHGHPAVVTQTVALATPMLTRVSKLAVKSTITITVTVTVTVTVTITITVTITVTITITAMVAVSVTVTTLAATMTATMIAVAGVVVAGAPADLKDKEPFNDA